MRAFRTCATSRSHGWWLRLPLRAASLMGVGVVHLRPEVVNATAVDLTRLLREFRIVVVPETLGAIWTRISHSVFTMFLGKTKTYRRWSRCFSRPQLSLIERRERFS